MVAGNQNSNLMSEGGRNKSIYVHIPLNELEMVLQGNVIVTNTCTLAEKNLKQMNVK